MRLPEIIFGSPELANLSTLFLIYCALDDLEVPVLLVGLIEPGAYAQAHSH